MIGSIRTYGRIPKKQTVGKEMGDARTTLRNLCLARSIIAKNLIIHHFEQWHENCFPSTIYFVMYEEFHLDW